MAIETAIVAGTAPTRPTAAQGIVLRRRARACSFESDIPPLYRCRAPPLVTETVWAACREFTATGHPRIGGRRRKNAGRNGEPTASRSGGRGGGRTPAAGCRHADGGPVGTA